MLYEKMPRPVTSPDMRERARALLGAAQRKQDIYAQALHQSELTTQPDVAEPLHPMPTAATGSLEHLVQSVTQACDQDLLHTQQLLTNARQQAHNLAAADAELHAFMAAAYGQAVLPHGAVAQTIDAQVPDGHQGRLLPGITGDQPPHTGD